MTHATPSQSYVKNISTTGPATIELQATVTCLGSLRTLLHGLDSATYREPLPLCFDSTIGAHTRHILDHYHCLLNGIDGQIINYDNRDRNLLLETCPEAATTRLAATCKQLLALTDLFDRDPPTTVLNAISVDEAIDETVTPVFSTLRRELRFLHSHTVHHLAIIRIMSGMLGLHVESHTGLSPATLQYRQRS
jgi:inactivated superfamily I helicase